MYTGCRTVQASALVAVGVICPMYARAGRLAVSDIRHFGVNIAIE